MAAGNPMTIIGEPVVTIQESGPGLLDQDQAAKQDGGHRPLS